MQRQLTKDLYLLGRPWAVHMILSKDLQLAWTHQHAVQVWAGSKQQELQVGSMQLMHQYAPLAAILLAFLVPVFEPIGLDQQQPGPDTLLGYPYTPAAVVLISSTALLGLLVSLSTFLVIGATSSVTFNVTGHMKTIIVIAGGVLLFGEPMPPKRLVGVLLAMLGILWYSYLRIRAPAASRSLPLPDKQPLAPPVPSAGVTVVIEPTAVSRKGMI